MKIDIWRIIMAAAAVSMKCCSANVLSLQRVRRNGTTADFEVFGHGDIILGLYYTTIALGSPSKKFNLEIDTASDISWVSCSSCSDCPRFNGAGTELSLYNISTSTTGTELPPSNTWCVKGSSQGNQCGYSISYQDGSNTSGHFVQDVLQLHPLTENHSESYSVPFQFGCSTNQSGLDAYPDFEVSGILGLSPGDHSIISQLSSQGFVPRVFSLCLQGDGNGGGKLILGKVVHPKMAYTPLVHSKSQYQVSLQKIAVNGETLPIDPTIFKKKRTIVDTGSTMASLIAEAFDPLVETVNRFVSGHAKIVQTDLGMCYEADKRGLEIFPSISLYFAGGSSIELRPKDYLFTEPVDPPRWCLGFMKSPDGYDFSILGEILLRDKIIVYDLYQDQFGWVVYDCSLSSFTVDHTYGFDKGGQCRSSIDSLIKLMLMLMFSIIIIVQY